MPPDTFISIAEDCGLIIPIGQWVLEQACRQAKIWADKGLHTNISINLSPKQFLVNNFQQNLVKHITHHAPPGSISIEVTENLLLEDIDNARKALEFFKNNQILCYLDDFGTGFSSLSYLSNLPFDMVKIDRSFIQDIEVNPSNHAIAATIVSLGHNLGMQVIAEGVENQSQLNELMTLGCDLVKGYYYSKALPAEEAEEWLNQSGSDIQCG